MEIDLQTGETRATKVFKKTKKQEDRVNKGNERNNWFQWIVLTALLFFVCIPCRPLICKWVDAEVTTMNNYLRTSSQRVLHFFFGFSCFFLNQILCSILTRRHTHTMMIGNNGLNYEKLRNARPMRWKKSLALGTLVCCCLFMHIMCVLLSDLTHSWLIC